MDPRSALAVKAAYENEECRRLLAGYSYLRPVFPRDADNESELALTEAICKVNKTLALVAIDSLQYYHFAESLGIDVASVRDKTAVVILDPLVRYSVFYVKLLDEVVSSLYTILQDESQFIMQGEYSRNALVQFINNYTNGYLRRSMRSTSPKQFMRSMTTKTKCRKDAQSKSVCVEELTTETFLDTVLNPDKVCLIISLISRIVTKLLYSSFGFFYRISSLCITRLTAPFAARWLTCI